MNIEYRYNIVIITEYNTPTEQNTEGTNIGGNDWKTSRDVKFFQLNSFSLRLTLSI